jgi:hypothetical protein
MRGQAILVTRVVDVIADLSAVDPIRLADGGPFAIAGAWGSWKAPARPHR